MLERQVKIKDYKSECNRISKVYYMGQKKSYTRPFFCISSNLGELNE